jgi:outer membrane lipoprotein-sorting protein
MRENCEDVSKVDNEGRIIMKMMTTIALLMAFLLVAPSVTSKARAAGNDYKRYSVEFDQIRKAKSFYDDPRGLYKELPYEKVIPREVYSELKCDKEEAKKLWATLVGFKAPDIVGKVAPEIKPGKYSYKDKEKYPGLKELMIPELYNRFKKGEAPFAGNFADIEIIPTRQYYYPPRIAEATKNNTGRTKQDGQGYLVASSYVSGVPFPAPTGPFKAQQYLYNWEKIYYGGESYIAYAQTRGYSKNLKTDFDSFSNALTLRLEGRLLFRPVGWYDDRAKARGELAATGSLYLAPRDRMGDGGSIVYYIDPNTADLFHIYAGSIRRIRKMSASDTQDSVGGSDIIYDDRQGFAQKLSPSRYPYKYEVLEEREYLWPTSSDGSEHFASGTLEVKNLRFERRPMVVLRLTQQDSTYVYSKRHMYFDKETFLLLHIENVDQKGRLYRTASMINRFDEPTGISGPFMTVFRDHRDLHSTLYLIYALPAAWMGRDDISLSSLVKRGK